MGLSDSRNSFIESDSLIGSRRDPWLLEPVTRRNARVAFRHELFAYQALMTPDHVGDLPKLVDERRLIPNVKYFTLGLSSRGLASCGRKLRVVMSVNDDVTVCDFCHQKRVTWKSEELAFRQSSDKGYVHCRVRLPMGTCQNCGAKSLEPGSDRMLDAAFEEACRQLQ